jgi:hypothetical protein
MKRLPKLFAGFSLICLLCSCGAESPSTVETSVSLAQVTATFATSPSLAISSGGGALAAWSQGNQSSKVIYANYYAPSTGWGMARVVGTGIGDEDYVKVSVNASASGMAVWKRQNGNSAEILAARFNPVGGWSTPTVLDSTGAGYFIFSADMLDVTVADSGNAMAVWSRRDTVNNTNEVVAAEYDPNSGWDTPVILQSGTSTFTQSMAGNRAGTVLAIWNSANFNSATNEVAFNTQLRRFVPGIGWLAAEPVGNDLTILSQGYYNPVTTPGHYAPAISVDENGNAVALWSEVYFQNDDYHLVTNRFEVARQR